MFMCVFWAGKEHRSTISCVCRFVSGHVSGHQCGHVVYVPILAVAVVCVCVDILVCISVYWRGSPIHLPPPLHGGLRSVAAADSSSSSKRPAQPPWISMLFPEGDFPPPPFPLAHRAFPRQGPAAPSSFLLNHLLTLKSKPILV